MNKSISLLAETINQSISTNELGALGAIILFVIFALVFALVIAVFVFWLIALVHLINNEDVKDRVLWIVLLFVVGGVIGPVYYFAVKKPYDKNKLQSIQE